MTGIHLRCGIKGISMRVFELHIAYTVLYFVAFRQRLDTNKPYYMKLRIITHIVLTHAEFRALWSCARAWSGIIASTPYMKMFTGKMNCEQ